MFRPVPITTTTWLQGSPGAAKEISFKYRLQRAVWLRELNVTRDILAVWKLKITYFIKNLVIDCLRRVTFKSQPMDADMHAACLRCSSQAQVLIYLIGFDRICMIFLEFFAKWNCVMLTPLFTFAKFTFPLMRCYLLFQERQDTFPLKIFSKSKKK